MGGEGAKDEGRWDDTEGARHFLPVAWYRDLCVLNYVAEAAKGYFG